MWFQPLFSDKKLEKSLLLVFDTESNNDNAI